MQMATETLKDKIIHHLSEAQNGLHYHKKLVNSLKSIMEEETNTVEEFFDAFLPPILNLLVVFKREPAAERLVDFVAKFTVAVAPKKPIADENSSSSEEDSENELSSSNSKSFIHCLLEKLVEFLKAKEKAVRFRSCQIISKILSINFENSTHRIHVSSNLLIDASRSLIERLRDKISIVRVYATSALTYLQDPTDIECPITAGVLWSMEHDSSFEVRKCAVLNICLTQKTLPALIARTRDVKDVVRSAAFLTLADEAKCTIRNLTIQQRLQVLNDGLRDDSPQVRKSCVSGLLRSWFMSLDGDFLELLRRLDVESSPKVVELVLMSLFDDIIEEELVKTFELIIELSAKDGKISSEQQSCLIPVEILNCELVFYWRCLCTYFKKQNSPSLERITPTLTQFCDYFHSFLETMVMSSADEEESLDLVLSEEYKAMQLCDIFSTLDFSDEAGRRQLSLLVYQLITNPKFPTSLVSPLLTESKLIWPQESYRIEKLIEIIADIRYPGHSDSTTVNESLSNLSYIDLKEDVGSLIKCLVVAGELFKELTPSTLTSPLQMLLDTLLIPCIQNENPYVRDLAVLALGLACLLDINLARHHILLFIQVSQVDHENVQATALRVVFDLLLRYGLEAFNVETNSQTETENTQDIITELLGDEGVNCETDKDKSILHILTRFLKGESMLLLEVTCEGFAKLLLSGRVVSIPLLVQLLLIWYTPMFQDESNLHAILGYFFSSFAAIDETHRNNMAETYIPFMKAILDAPPDSPLENIDVNNAAEFIVSLSAPVHSNEDSSHDNLAIQLCNYLLSNDFEEEEVAWTRIFCKTLSQLSHTKNNKNNARDTLVLVDKLIKIVLDKQSLKNLKKFKIALEKIVPAQLSTAVTIDDEINSNEILETNKENIEEPYHTHNAATPPHSSIDENIKSMKSRSKKYQGSDDDDTFVPGSKKSTMKKKVTRSKKNAKPVPKKVSEEEDSDDSLIGDHSPFVRTTRSKRNTMLDIPLPPVFTDDI